jgi:hypothetical protein
MCRPYIDTNNPQGMQLGRFKNRTPARFEYIYCTLFPLCQEGFAPRLLLPDFVMDRVCFGPSYPETRLLGTS